MLTGFMKLGPGLNFIGLLTICLPSAYHQNALMVTILLCKRNISSCVSEECLVMCGTHVHKQKFPANPRNMVGVNMEFPASVSADSLNGKQSHEMSKHLI